MVEVPMKAQPITYEDALISTPEERERVFGQSDHVRIYGEDFYDRLRQAGFVVSRIRLPSSPEECLVDYPSPELAPQVIVCKKSGWDVRD